MSLKLKFQLIAILTSFAFWIPVFTLFVQAHGLTSQQMYLLLTIYSFAVVFLEYPTGVFGDLFSHKQSVLLGYSIYIVIYLLTPLFNGFLLFLVFILLSSLGMTFISGSDAAFGHSSLKENFKRDYPSIKSAGTVATLIGITTGPILYKINPNLPFMLNGVAFAFAFLVMWSIPDQQHKVEESVGNAFSLAFLGIKSVIKSRTLLALLTTSAIVGAIAINMKWIYPSIFSNTNVAVSTWGILISLLYLARMLGTMAYKKFKDLKINEIVVLLALLIVVGSLGFTKHISILYPLLFAQFFVVGLLETTFDIDIQHAAEERVKASVLSLSSLLERLTSGLHLAILGMFATKSFLPFVGVTAVFIFLAVIALAFGKKSADQPDSQNAKSSH